MRKRCFISILGLLFLLAGCANFNGNDIRTDSVDSSDVMSGQPEGLGDSGLSKELEESGSSEPSESDFGRQDTTLQKPMKVTANTQDELISRENTDIRFAPISAANENHIFLYQNSQYGDKGVYSMEMGGSELERISLDIPDDMEVNQMAADIYGNIYLLLATDRVHRTEESGLKHMIWQVNKEYQVENVVDFTEAADGISMAPHYFVVDRNGCFYLQWGYGNIKALLMDPQGNLIKTASCESLEADAVNAAGIDSEGRLQILLVKDGRTSAARLDMQTGEPAESHELDFWHEGEVCLALGPGTDSGLLIFNDTSGIWSYDTTKESSENRNRYTERDEELNITVIKRLFLPDGRLFLLETVTKDGDLGGYQFRYVSGGK